ncbi:MAG TPA: SDR family oxidoreductase [Actinospica sp.]|jgi:NAD(P)-dependent dehydrogenase (short-subunit alcohol dehydrogenase family)|nr:SDR family oxidoreductase [Actinospica sp.]
MKHYVITGAASGIGQAIAARLHERGDTLHLVARNTERATLLTEQFPGAHTIVADLERPETIAGAVAGAELPERIDGLLHIAGALRLGAVAELTPEAWQASLAVNLTAPAELTRQLLPRLRHPEGHVLFVNSTSGLKTQKQWAAYSAGKYALRALADALRDEENGTGMRVTTLYPGRTATPMQALVHTHENRAYDPSLWIDPATVATTVLAALDLPADAEISDITLRVAPRA